MANSSGDPLAVFRPYDCSKSIFEWLPRCSLKALRLTCREMADLVASPASHLFSRAYISANSADLDALGAISTHPRIRLCVRELVWDVSTKPNRTAALYSTSNDKVERARKILSDYGHILERRLDFEALLLAIPRFPGLKEVVFIELMSLWIPRWDAYRGSESSHLTPRPPWFDTFQSPAMRQWSALTGNHSQMRPTSSYAPNYGDTFLSNPSGWVQRMKAQSTEFPEAAFDEQGLRPLRAPILFLRAMERFGLKLDSYRLDAVTSAFHGRRASPDVFGGFHMPFLASWDSVIAGFSEGFRSLRRLQLSIEVLFGDQSELGSTSWHQALNRMIKFAERLEELHLRAANRIDFDISNCLPRFSHLKKLLLDNFYVDPQVLEKELLPWSFAVKLQTLHLVHCVFPLGPQTNDLFTLLLARDVTVNACCPSSSLARDRAEGDPCHLSSEDASDASDSQALHEIVSDNDSASDFDSEGGVPQPVPFMDIEFGSEDEDDKNYFPCTDEMWSRHLDAPFGVEDDDLDDAYFTYYHDAEVRAYDDDFPDDEADILTELPIARLRPHEARFVPVPREESWELSLCGASWGSDHHPLQLWIDALHTTHLMPLS